MCLTIIGITLAKLGLTLTYPQGFAADVGCFSAWCLRITQVGPQNFYQPSYFADYPPGYMLILYALGKIANLFKIQFGSTGWIMLLRVPAILADGVFGYIVYKIGAKNINKRIGLFLMLSVLLNPAVVINSTFWGQVDSVLTLFIVLSLIMLLKRQLTLCGIFFALALLIKPQALLFAPIFICGFLDKFNLKAAMKSFACSISLMILASLIFMGSQPWWWLLQKYVNTLSSYNYATVNACNLYMLLGLNWMPLNNSLWQALNIFVIISTVILSVYFYIKTQDRSKIFFMGYLIIMTLFMFSTKMHERYMYPAIILLVFAYAYKPNKHLIYMLVIASATLFLNMYIVLRLDFYHMTPNIQKNIYSIIISCANILLWLYGVYYVIGGTKCRDATML